MESQSYARALGTSRTDYGQLCTSRRKGLKMECRLITIPPFREQLRRRSRRLTLDCQALKLERLNSQLESNRRSARLVSGAEHHLLEGLQKNRNESAKR